MKYIKEKSNFNKYPTTVIKGYDEEAWRGYEDIVKEITKKANKEKNIITVDCYVGVDEEEIIQAFQKAWNVDLIVRSEDIFYDSETMQKLLQKNITDDRVYGVAYYGSWRDLVDAQKLAETQEKVKKANGNILIVGVAADYIAKADVLVLADMTIWEIQMRYRNEKLANFKAHNEEEDFIRKYKRGYFIEWRLSNFHKQTLYDKFDYFLDTIVHDDPRMITRNAFENGLLQMLNQPFRTVPFFDEGLWGGQWMKEVCDVEDKTRINYAWSYNLLFQENEVNLTFKDIHINVPGYTLMQRFPKPLIGEKGFSRFGSEYPIRYDFLDTMEGGNLSLQVHPNTMYMNQKFGMPFTQDESYYFLDCAAEDTYMYLGLKTGVKKEEMEADLWAASRGEKPFPAEQYTNKIPVKKHEHYHIPAGTVHCSGKDTMVLEISSAPCIFTFKLWDWGRVGLDGIPRPVHIEHGVNNIQWDKQTDWVMKKCAFKPIVIEEDEFHKEEKTGLSDLEFLETRRIWMNSQTWHDTDNETNALNLIEGREALIESPDGQFEPFVIHFAESVCIPATIKRYTIRPYGESEGKEIAVMKTYVRF